MSGPISRRRRPFWCRFRPFPVRWTRSPFRGCGPSLLPPGDSGMDPHPDDLVRVPDKLEIDGVYMMPINNPTGRTMEPDRLRRFVEVVLDRWPHAGIILDSVYVRMHPRGRELLGWFDEDPRFADALLIVDSLSKTHGVTGLRSGVILTRSERLRGGGRAMRRTSWPDRRARCRLSCWRCSRLLQPATPSWRPTGSGSSNASVGTCSGADDSCSSVRSRLTAISWTMIGHCCRKPGHLRLGGVDVARCCGCSQRVPRAGGVHQGVFTTVAFYLATGSAASRSMGSTPTRTFARHGLLVNAGTTGSRLFRACVEVRPLRLRHQHHHHERGPGSGSDTGASPAAAVSPSRLAWKQRLTPTAAPAAEEERGASSSRWCGPALDRHQAASVNAAATSTAALWPT